MSNPTPSSPTPTAGAPGASGAPGAPGSLPRIGIVTPNYNGGDTLEATIQSILDQNYPGLEFWVIDGGSKDNSVEIIRRYEKHLTGWISEKDRGQSDAINKGLNRLTADVVNWICSDDRLMPGALHAVGRAFASDPDAGIVLGRCLHEFVGQEERNYTSTPSHEDIACLPAINPVAQPSCFYRRALLDRPGPIDETFNYGMDFELWCYFHSKGVKWKLVDDVLSVYRFDGGNKTQTAGMKAVHESRRIYRRYSHDLIPLTFWYRWVRFPVEAYRIRHPGRLADEMYWYVTRAFNAALGPIYGHEKVKKINWRWFVQ